MLDAERELVLLAPSAFSHTLHMHQRFRTLLFVCISVSYFQETSP